MPRSAWVTAGTTAIAGTGRGFELEAGTYQVVEIDGAAARGEVYITGPGGRLCRIDPHDPNIKITATD